MAAPEVAPGRQAVADISATAERFVYEQAAASGRDIVVTAGFLDPRLKLPHCGDALDVVLRPQAELVGRVVVGVRCTGQNPWKVYLPVYVGVMEKVFITARQLPREHIVVPGDVVAERRDVSALRGDYVPASADIVGSYVTRSLGTGLVLRPSALRDRILVEKGQTVVLSMHSDLVSIQVAGIAHADGAANQRIQVRNTTSGKLVEGRVLSQGVVDVSLP